MNYTWRSTAMVALGIVLALVCADLAMSAFYNVPAKRQVRDGLKDLQRIPNVLAVSSSHGRSFHVLGDTLRDRTDGGTDLIAVALEAGKVDAMEWVLHNRLKPVIVDHSGAVREPLTHMIFGITWWDTCRQELPTQTAHNVVTHGWTASDYLDDFSVKGATELNRNYVRNLWRHSFSASALVRTRFAISENFSRFTNFLRVMVLGGLPEDEYQQTLDRWHDDIDNGHQCYLSDMDMAALDRFTEFTKQHKLDFTVVLFPLKPDTITETGLRDTIKPFATALKAYGKEHAIRVVDMTLGILDDNEFMLDLDHVTPSGNVKWSEHALDNELKFLLGVSPVGAAQ